MSTGKAVRKTQPAKRTPTAAQAAVQEALEVTWTLKGHLKNAHPDLADAADMIWIETALAQQALEPTKRAALQGLLKKALDGQLREGDLSRYRRRGSQAADESLKAFHSKLRLLRMRGSQIKILPPEVIAHLDAAIETLENAITVQRAG